MSDAGYPGKAFSMVLQAFGTMKDLTLEDKINYYKYCNIIYNHKKEHNKSIELADSLLWVLDRSQESPLVSSARIVAYNIKADALFAMGRYNDAYNYYYVAQRLAVDSKDSCSLRTYTYSLAMTLYRQQRFQQSAQRFQEAFSQSAPCPEDFNLFYFKQEVLDNVGLCYNALAKYDSAMLYYHKALNLINSREGKFDKLPGVYETAKAVVYGNMAEVYMHKGKFDSAERLYEYSIAVNLKKGFTNSDAIVNQTKLAELYFRTGDMVRTKALLTAIEAEFDTIPDKRVEMLWHRLMWKYSERVYDSATGFRHLRNYMLQNEAYEHDRKELMETDLDMRVRDLEKQYQINLLTKDRKQQKAYLIVVTILAGMAIVIVGLVLRNASRSRRNLKIQKALNDTIQKQKEQLEGALAELKNKEKDKTRILRSVAHDVMNPIAAIVSLTDILFYEKESLNEEQLHIINLIREASANSLNLSKDIIEAAEQQEDREHLTMEETDINLLVARAVELLNFRALSKRQQIITRYPAQHIMAVVYKDKIRRVINNLIANAIKFSYEGTVINVSLELREGMAHLSVRDSGIGIPAKNLPYIFDVFTDARQAGTQGEVTHGLGLSISMQIARAHNGDIWVESEEGKGATFHFEFPLKKA